MFVDLGFAPPSNAYRRVADLNRPEVTYPLRVRVCDTCFLVQTEDFTEAEALFSSDYAYFSSTSKQWLAHASDYARMITARLGLSGRSLVVELASNDGYLLRNFVSAGIPCLGIEPTVSTAKAARALGVETIEAFFGTSLAERLRGDGRSADLIVGNNVYAHVPDINDFTAGIATLLKAEGVVTLEFPQLMQLVAQTQFDTIYHEHFSYLSLSVVDRIFRHSGLRVFDIDILPTHGGSLRVYGCRTDAGFRETEAVEAMKTEEARRGMTQGPYYDGFQARAEAVKNAALTFLLEAKRGGKSVTGYGAAAKGNTLLNFAGIGRDLLPFVCDAAPAKQGMLLPGSHIPILHPDALYRARPDYVIVLPWNIADEVKAQLAPLLAGATRLVTFVPEVRIH